MLFRSASARTQAGFLPALSWLWAQMIDRPLLSPYRLVWGMTLVVAIAALSLKPLLTMVMANFG